VHSGNGRPSASVVKGHSIVEHTSVQVNVGQQRGDWLENGKCECDVVMAMSAIGRNSHTVSAIMLLYCASTIQARKKFVMLCKQCDCQRPISERFMLLLTLGPEIRVADCLLGERQCQMSTAFKFGNGFRLLVGKIVSGSRINRAFR
jgi:hypothetical protein